MAAFPAPGATDVSPQTSIVLRTDFDALPAGLALLANGSQVPLPAISKLGPGLTPAGHAIFFQLYGPLMPSTNYALVIAGSATGASGPSPVELTHFSTSATYDKAQGTAPVINSVRLWRAHYPESEVGAGGCVFAAYEGYFDIDFAAGTVPGTPPEEVVSILTISSRQTDLLQSLVFMGLDQLPGGFVTSAGGNIPLAGGGALSAPQALWKPVLEADGTTCATISTFGRNNLAAPSLQSNTVCVPVTSVDSPHLTPGAGGAGAAGVTGGAGASGSAGAPGATGTTRGSSGCAVMPAGTARGGSALVLAALGLMAARRRRK